MLPEPDYHPEGSLSGSCAQFRFYGELNAFLQPQLRKQTFCHAFRRGFTLQQVIEGLGVPPGRVDLILVNGSPVQFDFLLGRGDRVAVYPVFETFDIAGVSGLRESPLRQVRFILDVHLGKLARLLRMLGFDAL
jgi:hypothetical protein